MEGMYNCPFKSEGYLIFTFGQKFKRIASFIKVNEPLIRACEAITAANVAMIIPTGWNHFPLLNKMDLHFRHLNWIMLLLRAS